MTPEYPCLPPKVGEEWGNGSDNVHGLMAGPNPHKLYSFAELRAVYGPLWVRCDVCRRFRALRMTATIRERDYRTTRFTCTRCGSRGYCAIDRPTSQHGMEDYVEDTPSGSPL